MTNYGWNKLPLPKSCGYIMPAIVDLLGSEYSRLVLDLGCGNGVMCGKLDRIGFSVVGVEPSFDGYEIARKSYPSIPFFNLSVSDSPIAIVDSIGLCDVVVSTEVIEHLYSPHHLTAFAWDCLKPGGVLIMSTPYHGYFKNLLLSIFNKWDDHHTADWCGGHIKFWSRRTLSRLISEQGFIVHSFHGVGRLPWLWKSMILVAKKPSF